MPLLLRIQHLLLPVLFLLPVSIFAQSLERHEFSSSQMGTEFRIVLYAKDSLQAADAAQAAFRRIDKLNTVLSDYDSESELSRLSATAGSSAKVAVSDDLWAVLQAAQQVARASKGAFDISVGPLTKLWRRAFRQQQFPKREDLQEAQKRVNYRWIKLYANSQSVQLKKPEMRLDLGGIAKGYAVDEAVKTLRQHGLHQIMVDGGGDIYVAEAPPGKSGWTIERPFLQNGEVASEVIEVVNTALATSGDTYRYLEWNGLRYSHLINPRTGLGLTNRRLVTVTAPTCTIADALASACSVMQKEKALKLAASYKAEARILEQ